MYGRVTKYHHDKDYGFIMGEDKQTYFVHQSRLNGEYLDDGYLVSFHPYQNYKGKNNANLLSKLDDAVTTLSLNPLGVLATERVPDEQLDNNMVGACITLGEGGEFKYATVTMDYANIKQELDSLLTHFYEIACVPAAVVGQSNVSNVSEVSLSMLFNSTDDQDRLLLKIVSIPLIPHWN